MLIENVLKSGRKALIIGIGGGGDVVGTLPTMNFLKTVGMESIIGGLPWERSSLDPQPGPRKFNETVNVDKINETVWKANRHSSTISGVKFAEAGVAEVLGRNTILINIRNGVNSIVDGIVDACRFFNADVVIGIDVGGDSVAFGNEKGLTSPLADAIMTSVLYKLQSKVSSFMGILGFGSDGELTIDELEASFRVIAKNNGILGSWGITNETLELMKKVIDVVPTEASRLPVEYAMGKFEESFIRNGKVKVILNLCSTITFYLDPKIVFENISKPAQAVIDCKNLEEANKKLNKLGIKTELDLEREA